MTNSQICQFNMAAENESTETARLRQIVREELEIARSGDTNTRNPVRLSTQSVYERTQQLIRGAANSAVNELSQIRPQQVLATTAPRAEVSPREVLSTPIMQGSRSSTGKRKSQPSHPWRLKAAPKRKAVEGKSIYVWLLDYPIDDSGSDYVLDDAMVLLKGFVTLNPNDTPKDIKQKITSLFQTKFPHIESFQYDFVKRERNKISTPTTESNFSWNFSALKNLWGQGKLYCRLNVTRTFVEEGTDSGDDEIEHCSYLMSNSSSGIKNTLLQEILTTSTDQPLTSDTNPSTSGTHPSTSGTHPSTSDTPPSTSDTHPSTSGIYPSTSGTHPSASSTEHSKSATQMLDDNASRVSELQNLVHELLEKQEKPHTFNTLNDALSFLNSKLNDRERLRVDQNYVLEEALAYYKSPEFQPYAKMIIQYKGQSAIDTGGVLRQFFTDVFTQIMEGGGDLPPLFEGYVYRKLPVHNAGTVLSGVLELVGKIIAHSIIQAGIGPCCLSPPVYRFLATGDLNEAITLLSIDDVVNPALKNYIKLVRTNICECMYVCN